MTRLQPEGLQTARQIRPKGTGHPQVTAGAAEVQALQQRKPAGRHHPEREMVQVDLRRRWVSEVGARDVQRQALQT